MSDGAREPVPGGVVSTIRGRWQSPGLAWVTRVLLALGVGSAVVPGTTGTALAVAAVVLVIAVPLLRLVWLVLRWWQEGDRRFVAAGLGVLTVVAAGAALAASGVGG